MELLSDLNILALYPSGFFLVFLSLFVIYWVLSIIGGLDQNFGFDLDIDGDVQAQGMLSGLLISFGFSKVPLSIGLTFASFIGFIICSFIQINILGLFFTYNAEFNPYNIIYLSVSTIVVFVSLFAALWLAGKAIKPLIPLFDDEGKNMDVEYIGLKAKVRSSKVTNTFGEVILEEGLNEHILTVYSNESNIGKNDEVIIVDYNKEIKRYLVKKELI